MDKDLGRMALTFKRSRAGRIDSQEWSSFMRAELKMATGQVWIGWSLRAPKTETRSRNPKPKPKPIRVEIQHQNQTRGYPKLERIPETRMIIQNPWIYRHIFTYINKM
jgi:hypothetical protein